MNRNKLITAIATGTALVVVAFFFIIVNPALQRQGTLSPQQQGAGSLIVQDEAVGAGDTAQAGDLVTVNYTGRLQNGTVFDTSIGKDPIQFVLGTGRVIPGWDQGLQGMKVGGKRLLIIPPDLAYGPQGIGPIPGNSTLIFEVTLVDVQKPTRGIDLNAQ